MDVPMVQSEASGSWCHTKVLHELKNEAPRVIVIKWGRGHQNLGNLLFVAWLSELKFKAYKYIYIYNFYNYIWYTL
jgi:hypothetical protein